MIRFEPDVVGGAAALEKARAEGRTAYEVISRAVAALYRDRHQRTKGAVLDPPEWREVIAHAKERGVLIEKPDEPDGPDEVEIATAIGLLTLRKMQPQLEVPTLVGPFYRNDPAFRKLFEDLSTERKLPAERLLRLFERDDINAAAEREATPLGIEFQDREMAAEILVVHTRGGERRHIRRRHLYAFVDHEHVIGAARAFVRWIHAEMGPGRVWTLGGRVSPILDDGLAVAIERDGRTLLVLRSMFAHEHDPEAT